MAAITQLRPWGLPGAAYPTWVAKTAATVGSVGRKKLVTKPKRRKFTFPNGMTVWASDERMARLMAGFDGPATAATAPETAPATGIQLRKAPAAAAPVDLNVNEARQNTLDLRRRRLAAEELIILHLLMDEAA